MNNSREGKPQLESLEEIEQIEGNYYKVDLFVSSALALFTSWVFFLEKNLAWTIFLGIMSLLFLYRGIRNWKEKTVGVKTQPVNLSAGKK